jgi:hypothetical protein
MIDHAGRSMRRLWTIPGFVHVLVAMFIVAQFSGVVPSPRSNAQPVPDAIAHAHHQHAADHTHDHGQGPAHHHDGDNGNLADTCCALHAYFAGVLPPVIAIEATSIVGQRLAAGINDHGFGVPPDRLDRPPRPLLRS